MKVLISASNELSKWMGLDDLPRLPHPTGKQVGVTPLITNADTIAWQCHVLRPHSRVQQGIIIAVEAHSRYTLLIPTAQPPTQMVFEELLAQHWLQNLAYWLVDTLALDEARLPEFIEQFAARTQEFSWVKNTNLSVNGHVADAGQWVQQSFEHYAIHLPNDEECFALGVHINKMFKRVKTKGKKGEPFYPVPRLVDDGLSRFWGDEQANINVDAGQPPTNRSDNVVSLTQYRQEQEKNHE